MSNINKKVKDALWEMREELSDRYPGEFMVLDLPGVTGSPVGQEGFGRQFHIHKRALGFLPGKHVVSGYVATGGPRAGSAYINFDEADAAAADFAIDAIESRFPGAEVESYHASAQRVEVEKAADLALYGNLNLHPGF